MKLVLSANECCLISITSTEFVGINNALNEICNGVQIDDAEFQTRLGVTRDDLIALLAQFSVVASDFLLPGSRTDTWADGTSVQAICISACGDPVDMSVEEAKAFRDRLDRAIQEADGPD
jgi:hypothetical protein